MADFSTYSDINTSTQYAIVGKIIDVITDYSPLTMHLLGNQKKWDGMDKRFPIKYQKSTNGMNFVGLEQFNTNVTTNRTYMKFNPVGKEQPVVVPGLEQDLNATKPVINLLKSKAEEAAIDAADDIATQIYTLQTGNNFLSVLDVADDGTNASTYGNLSRSTYTGIQGNYTASVGTLTRATMSTMFNSCEHGKESPNLIIVPKAVWNYVETLLTPTVQTSITNVSLNGYSQWTRNGIVPSAAGLKGETGFNAIFFRGVPVVADEKAPAGTMLFLNMNHIAFYGLPTTVEGYKPFSWGSDTIEDVYDADLPKVHGWSFSGFKVPIDQYGVAGHVLLNGNLIADNPRLFGQLTGITGV